MNKGSISRIPIPKTSTLMHTPATTRYHITINAIQSPLQHYSMEEKDRQWDLNHYTN
nr:MAG TPA: hypothetical protein [Caudoviricetes sp.]